MEMPLLAGTFTVDGQPAYLVFGLSLPIAIRLYAGDYNLMYFIKICG